MEHSQLEQNPVAYAFAHVHINGVILDSVGRGEYFYIATVAKSWRIAYARAAAGWRRCKPYHTEPTELINPTVTTYRAALRSPQRLRLAAEYGIIPEFSKEMFFLGAGHVADVPTLQLACELGMDVHMEVASFSNPVTYMFIAAARMARRDTIRWMVHEKHCAYPDNMAAIAVHSRSLSFLDWLAAESVNFTAEAATTAAMHESNAMLEWVLDRGIIPTPEAMQAAARAGSMRCLEMLRSVGCPVLPGAANAAASVGQLEALKWLCANGCRIDLTTIGNRAVGSGHVEVVRFVYSELHVEYTQQDLRTAVLRAPASDDSRHLAYLSVVQYLVNDRGLEVTAEL